MKKSVVIAGNGPSAKEVDYRRLPEDYDVFRCNQFFFEDKYYLGKNVTGFFMSTDLMEELFTASSILNMKKEYNIQSRYCPMYATNELKKSFERFYSLKYASDIFRSQESFLCFIDEWANTYQKHPTTGISMIFTAVAMGYTEIYVTGIDFYKAKEGNIYNYTIDPKSLYAQNTIIPKPEMYGTWHSEEIERAAIELVKQFKDMKIYSLSENTELSKLLPLAPIQNDKPYVPEEKPEGYLKDIVLSKRQQEEERRQEENKSTTGKIVRKIKAVFIEKDLEAEWEFLRRSSFVRFGFSVAKQLYHLVKLFLVMIKVIIKLLFNKKRTK